ncbi:hypothetical protein JXA80_03245 [bacterium]|nr:hypothetical protein [candidate division CSSED10-310 bacterium]
MARQPGYAEIRRRVRRLIFSQSMFHAGDRVAVGYSGGKDSTFLLHLLRTFQDEFSWPFSLCALRVVDPDSPCHDESDVKTSKAWCESIGVPMIVLTPPGNPIATERIPVRGGPAFVPHPASACFRCSWRRKETLFRYMAGANLSILALGHTAFDLAVTAVMNMMYHGNLETMPAVMEFFNGAIRVIRPLSPVTEDQVIRHQRRLNLPASPPSCRSAVGAARAEVEQWVRAMVQSNPHAIRNILKAATRWSSQVLENPTGSRPT